MGRAPPSRSPFPVIQRGLQTRHTGEEALMKNSYPLVSVVSSALVSVVDDDESVRESLPDLLRQLGFAAEAFSSGEEFLALLLFPWVV